MPSYTITVESDHPDLDQLVTEASLGLAEAIDAEGTATGTLILQPPGIDLIGGGPVAPTRYQITPAEDV